MAGRLNRPALHEKRSQQRGEKRSIQWGLSPKTTLLHTPPLHHPSLHPFVPPSPLFCLSISVSLSSFILWLSFARLRCFFLTLQSAPHPQLSCPLYLLISSHLISVHSDFPFFPSSCFYVCEFHNICFLSSLCGYCEWEGIMEMSLSEPFITKRSHLTRCSDMLSPHLSQQEILWHN